MVALAVHDSTKKALNLVETVNISLQPTGGDLSGTKSTQKLVLSAVVRRDVDPWEQMRDESLPMDAYED